MSANDKNLAIGRAVEEYGQNRADLGALAQRAQQLGNLLHHLSEYLRRFGKDSSGLTSETIAIVQNLPSVEEMRELVAEMQAATARRQQLRSILRDAGVDPKD